MSFISGLRLDGWNGQTCAVTKLWRTKRDARRTQPHRRAACCWGAVDIQVFRGNAS
jgi:hypothetical protein